MKLLSDCMIYLPRLQKLCLKGNYLVDTDMATLCYSLQYTTNLRELSLEGLYIFIFRK